MLAKACYQNGYFVVIRNLLPLQDLYMGLEKTAAHDLTGPASCRCAPINEHNWLCLCFEIILLLTR
ncbi:hypothetical protein T10_4310 [Trichinella papuae]|uniref:Uncharacterized protein n=1 Tax=Trichinella papuae TaxID=268474 RepID=A0A0V1MPG4_9BILA|nr:hypothetical protein T10_4310 [Trichinella papuae]